MNINQEILQKAIDTNGKEAQMAMIQEECMELAIALHKRLNRNWIAEEDIISEIADVTIMLAQANLIFDKHAIQAEVNKKMKRLENRLLWQNIL
jgi:NTP pyrophosphatase (non-canonical NTP hydrolase)